MAKNTFLQLTNQVLRYINQAEVASVTGATGHAAIVKDKLNESLNNIYTNNHNLINSFHILWNPKRRLWW